MSNRGEYREALEEEVKTLQEMQDESIARANLTEKETFMNPVGGGSLKGVAIVDDLKHVTPGPNQEKWYKDDIRSHDGDKIHMISRKDLMAGMENMAKDKEKLVAHNKELLKDIERLEKEHDDDQIMLTKQAHQRIELEKINKTLEEKINVLREDLHTLRSGSENSSVLIKLRNENVALNEKLKRLEMKVKSSEVSETGKVMELRRLTETLIGKNNLLFEQIRSLESRENTPVPTDEPNPVPLDPVDERTFPQELKDIINKHSMDNGSNTPDYMLCSFLLNCLDNFNYITQQRSRWYQQK